MTPGVPLFAALSRGEMTEHAGKDRPGVFPADMLQQLKTLIDEVQRMAHV